MNPMLGPSGSDSTTSRNSREGLATGTSTPAVERLHRDRLDPREQAGQEVLVTGFDRREREAAVAAHHRGHAVQRRWRQCLIPEDLRVVVRVQVDETRE